MQKINFEDATLVTQAKVTVDGTDYEVTPATYSGGTDLDANTFNDLQDNMEASFKNTSSNSTTDGYCCKYLEDNFSKKGTVLYDNASGNDGTIDLNDSSANYSFIEIYYKSNDNVYRSLKIDNPNGKKVALDIMHPTATTQSTVYLKTKEVNISGNKITNGYYGELALTHNSPVIEQANNNIFITKVIGYK